MLIIVCIVAMLASLLTFYSGFGLGTLLSAVLFLFFDVPSALLITAIVHLSNNIFKLAMIYRHIHWHTMVKFGLASIAGAFLGSYLLELALSWPPIYQYEWSNKQCTVTWIKIVMALLMLFFTYFEILPYFKRWTFSSAGLPLGGAISGFFGGLSGHQGALRSIFLLKANLTKEAFIATGVMIACLVDFTRLPMYLAGASNSILTEQKSLIIAATLSAFIGAFVGAKLLHKITESTVQMVVTILITFIACLMIIGYL